MRAFLPIIALIALLAYTGNEIVAIALTISTVIAVVIVFSWMEDPGNYCEVFDRPWGVWLNAVLGPLGFWATIRAGIKLFPRQIVYSLESQEIWSEIGPPGVPAPLDYQGVTALIIAGIAVTIILQYLIAKLTFRKYRKRALSA